MATKNITDKQVVQAYLEYKSSEYRYPSGYLVALTGEPEKVCIRAMERAADRGYIEYGVSLRTGWVTKEGLDLVGGENQN